jgi:hypothetical protein
MLKFFARICATIALVSAPPMPLASSPPRALDVDQAAIAIILCGGERAGTAFWIAPTRIMTAAHVTRGAACQIGGVPVELVREDGDNDVAELRSAEAHPFLRVSCDGFRAGQLYRAIGYVGGEYRANMPWIPTGFRDPSGQNEFIGQAEPGMSGGPVIGRGGDVAGVVNQRWPARSRALKDTFVCGG